MESSLGVLSIAAIVLLVLVIGTVPAPIGAQAERPEIDQARAFEQTQVDADAVLLSVQLQTDGDARWRVEYRVRLDDANTTAAFEDLQVDVERNESAYVARFEDRMAITVDDAAATTGREMSVRNVGVSTTNRQLPESYGVLVYTFEWTNFAVVDGDKLRGGDALAGFFLDADSSLLVTWPEDYELVDATPEPTETRERSVVWRGPTDFGTDGPRLVVSIGGSGADVTPSLAGVAIVILVLTGGGALWWWRSRETAASPTTESESTSAADGTDEKSDRPPEELLSNEERVIALIEEHGGRMKQQDVVQALDWTDAKTSQVVGKLRESGEIEGFRLGRENVLRLPAVDESPAPGDVAPDEDGG